MADYIIVLYPGTKEAYIYPDWFATYEDAKEEAERNGEPYRIYASCTDQRNHVI